MFTSCATRLLPLFVVGLTLVACSSGKRDDPRTEAPLVRTATVEPQYVLERAFTGVVVARVESNLGFRVPGKIIERLVDTGQTVRRGQPLMRIDPIDLSLSRQAAVDAVIAAQARAGQASADEARYRDLVTAGAVSASANDQTRASAEAARAELRAAQAQAEVAANQAHYAVLLADSDGVVVDTLAEPGQVVAAGQTVVRLAHSGPREARVDLPEGLRPVIGSLARAMLYVGAGKPASARLRQLSDAADPTTRTYDARYVLDGVAADAPLGTTVTLRIPDPRALPSLSVPLAALYDPGRGPGVWIIAGDPSRVTWHSVTVASVGEEAAQISNGIDPGERFVALGAQLLHEGEQVRVASGDGVAQ